MLYEKLIEKENYKRILLKIDVEGYDLRVLKGATRIIKKFAPIVVIESRPTSDIIEQIYNILPDFYLIKSSSSFLYKSVNQRLDCDLVCLPIKN